MFVAGMLASSPENATTIGCQTIPENAQVQVLERYPTAFHFLQIVKAQVTAPSLPDPKVGTSRSVARRPLGSGLKRDEASKTLCRVPATGVAGLQQDKLEPQEF